MRAFYQSEVIQVVTKFDATGKGFVVSRQRGFLQSDQLYTRKRVREGERERDGKRGREGVRERLFATTIMQVIARTSLAGIPRHQI